MSGSTNNFREHFKALTSHEPHSWQARLYKDWLSQGKIPQSISIPTGAGKTSIMGLWLLALASGATLPRRLVWVVDRRVVVDQATHEAEKLRTALSLPGMEVARNGLFELSASGHEEATPVAISTLRGEHADNREWSKDPSRPAIVVGTVDMVGSRLLFSGYGDGRWHRPFHAGLLAVDTLVVLDEAQLSAPFEAIVREIESIQLQQRSKIPLPSFHFLPISATLRSGEMFRLIPSEWTGGGFLPQILQAPKRLRWHGTVQSPLPSEEFLAKVGECALAHQGDGSRVVVYLDRVRDVPRVARILEKVAPEGVVVLTGTMRGHERDGLTDGLVFKRFLNRSDTGVGNAYLVSTSAGEVGIDLYADHMVSDLVSVERMIQRFGRVNRAGEGNAVIDIVIGPPETPKKTGSGKREDARRARQDVHRGALLKTESYLRSLSGVSPSDLEKRPPPVDAYSPPPPFPPLRSWLLDIWSLTSLRHPDLPVDAWLRGTDTDSAEVYFAWRGEVNLLANRSQLDNNTVETILEEYRLLPKEILRSSIGAARKALALLAKAERTAAANILILSPSGEVEYRGPLGLVLNEDFRIRPYRTFILPPTVGGLDERGMLEPTETRPVKDVSKGGREHGLLKETEDGWEFNTIDGGDPIIGASRDEVLRGARRQLDLPRIRSFPLKSNTDQELRQELVYLKSQQEPGSLDDPKEMLLADHLKKAGDHVEAMAGKLRLPRSILECLKEAARQHDLGKARVVWQEYARNQDVTRPLAKSVRYRGPEVLGGYRHEMGSLIDLRSGRTPLVEHLVAAHHGHGRPHFADSSFDKEHLAESRREQYTLTKQFPSLQREYGWWGLAYLESILKAADVRASP